MAVLAVAFVLLTAGCGTISVFVDLQGDLEEAGFRSVAVNVDTGDKAGESLRIGADPPPGVEIQDAQDRGAEITWKTFSRRFDRVSVSISGTSRTYGRSELTEQFGPRPDGLDDTDLGDDVRRIGVGVVIALAVGAILCVGLIVTVVLLVRRFRKKKRIAQSPWPGQSSSAGLDPGGYPPAGYAAPGYPSAERFPPGDHPPHDAEPTPPKVPPGWE